MWWVWHNGIMKIFLGVLFGPYRGKVNPGYHKLCSSSLFSFIKAKLFFIIPRIPIHMWGPFFERRASQKKITLRKGCHFGGGNMQFKGPFCHRKESLRWYKETQSQLRSQGCEPFGRIKSIDTRSNQDHQEFSYLKTLLKKRAGEATTAWAGVEHISVHACSLRSLNNVFYEKQE